MQVHVFVLVCLAMSVLTLSEPDPGSLVGGRRVPFEGRLKLDKVGPHTWCCTDILTGASHSFDFDNCELVFLEDMALIVGVDTAAQVDPSEWFDIDSVRDCGGTGEVWKARSLPDGKVEILGLFDEMVATHEPRKCEMVLGNTNAKTMLCFREAKAWRCQGRLWFA